MNVHKLRHVEVSSGSTKGIAQTTTDFDILPPKEESCSFVCGGGRGRKNVFKFTNYDCNGITLLTNASQVVWQKTYARMILGGGRQNNRIRCRNKYGRAIGHLRWNFLHRFLTFFAPLFCTREKEEKIKKNSVKTCYLSSCELTSKVVQRERHYQRAA